MSALKQLIPWASVEALLPASSIQATVDISAPHQQLLLFRQQL
jgi:hypothetical protein